MQIRKLNALRGIAAMIVVVSHYSNETNLLNGDLGHGAGQFGVMLFFILSGFLMSYLNLHKSFDKGKVGYFVVARVAKVVPLFLLIVLASFLLNWMGVHAVLYDIIGLRSLFSHLALLFGTSVLWTISVEVQFYGLFLGLWWLFQKRAGALYLLLPAVFMWLAYRDFPQPVGTILGIPYQNNLYRALPYFFIGMLFGRLQGRWQVPKYLRSHLFVLALLLIPFMYPRIYFKFTGLAHEMWQDVGVFGGVSLVFFCLLFFVPDTNVILSNRLGDFLGKISYSLYLLHLPILWQLSGLASKNPPVFLAVYLLLVVGVAYLSFLWVEEPFRKSIRRALLLKKT